MRRGCSGGGERVKLRHLGHCEVLKAADQKDSGVTVDVMQDITILKK